MNPNGESFLNELKVLCNKHFVSLVEEWTGDDDDDEIDNIFVGIHFQGPDFWLPITDMLLESEED